MSILKSLNPFFIPEDFPQIAALAPAVGSVLAAEAPVTAALPQAAAATTDAVPVTGPTDHRSSLTSLQHLSKQSMT